MTEKTFEDALQQLEGAVGKLENGSLTLEAALTSFEEGIHWSKKCHQFLDKAEKRIEMILKDEEGKYSKTEFTDDKDDCL
ncbi:MAG: exodeoxyribonuclease VII small subunit [SAR324 cluster bacterium]|nr:exodeoxyribonuclease VII small subunit [SAR324 cluster bacterium]